MIAGLENVAGDMENSQRKTWKDGDEYKGSDIQV